MKKRWIIKTVLAIALCIISLVLTNKNVLAAYLLCGVKVDAVQDDLAFKLNSNGTSYTVTHSDDVIDCKGLSEYDDFHPDIIIPSTVNGRPVTAIGEYAFTCDQLETLTIPVSITKIGADAFRDCDELVDVYYGGTACQWAKIKISSGNNGLKSATIHVQSAYDGGHTWDSGKVTKAATCTTTGVMTYTCSNCSSKKTATIAKLTTHNWSSECDTTCNICGTTRSVSHDYNAATCAKPKTCKICGATTGGTKAHNYNAATCTSPQTCKDCGATSGSAMGHNYADATCTKAATCKTCGATSGSANGHNYADATCTKAKTCKTCGATSGSAKGHNYADATCTKAKTCKTCGVTTGSTTGHNYADATCTKAKTCKTCGVTTGSAKGHNYADATCTSPQTCKTCGVTTGSAKGHNYKAATCTAPKTCKTCGTTSGKKLSHTYKTTTTKATLKKDGSIVKKCTNCGKVESSKTIQYVKTIKLSKTSYTYDGKVKTPTVTVKNSAGKKLKEGTDYTVSYAKGRKNVGEYKVTIKFKGNYSGTKVLTFKIKAVSVSKCKISLSKTKFTYDGKVKKPTVTVKNSAGKKLKEGTDYTVTYAKGRKNIGTYKVTIKMKGNYSGNKTLSFEIVLATPKVTVTATSKGAKITWNKVAGANLYAVYRSTYSNGKWSKAKQIATTTNFNYTDKSIKKGTTYKYTIKAIKNDDNASGIVTF